MLENPKIQTEIESIRKCEYFSNIYELAKRIETEYFEEIYEKDKRNYSLSGHYKYVGQQFPIQYRKVIHNSANQVPDLDGNVLTIVKVGRLAYKAPLQNANYIDNFHFYLGDSLIFKVFTRFDEKKLFSDESYRRAVFKELLSKKNLFACLKTSYIGEIKSTESIFGENVEIGEEKAIFEGHSKDYSFIYDYDALAAVQLHIKQQHQYTGTNPKNREPH